MRAWVMALGLLAAAPAIGQSQLALDRAALAMKPWSIGEERELAPGNYVRLVEVDAGWRLWRFENADGIVCSAVRPSDGKPDPIPIGVAQKMFSEGPYLSVAAFKKNVTGRLNGSASGAWAKYRVSGQRFWTDEDVTKADLSKLEGQKVEVDVISYREPVLKIGMVEDQGIIDFTGYVAMRAKVGSCARQKPND